MYSEKNVLQVKTSKKSLMIVLENLQNTVATNVNKYNKTLNNFIGRCVFGDTSGVRFIWQDIERLTVRAKLGRARG